MKAINSLTCFFGYFVQGLLLVSFNTFLPVLLVTVLEIPESEIAFAQLISYAAFFIKPIFALISDKARKKERQNPKRKIFIFMGSIGLLISFFFMIFSVQSMIIFGIFWSINYFCMSIVDVAIDGSIIDTSPNIRAKERKITLIQIGNSFGNITASLLYVLFISNIDNLSQWSIFLNSHLFILSPLIFISYLMHEEFVKKEDEEKIVKEKIVKKLDDSYLTLNFIFMSIFLILFYSEVLVQVPYEPWLVERFGGEGFRLYSFFLIFAPFIIIIGYVLKNTVFKYSDRKRILYISLILVGLFDICIPLMNLWILIILGMLILIPNAIANIAFISLMMEFAKEKYSYKYQVLATMVIISRIIFGPLGTFLSGFIDTSILLVILGILILGSIIPVLFIKMQRVANFK